MRKRMDLRLGEDNFIDNIYQWCIGLLPVLCLYNTPVLNKSLGTVLLLLSVPYVLYRMMPGFKINKSRVSAIPFLLLYTYMVFRAEGNIARIILCISTAINIIGAAYGVIKAEKIRKVMEWFAILNTILVVIQTLSYYGLNIRIQYIPRELIHSVFSDSSVFSEYTGLYRPSALFLEPAHYAQYCCFALISVLFPVKGKANLKRAAIIAMGVVLTTSGMGIMVTFGICAWYVVFGKVPKGTKIISVLKWIPVMAIIIVILLQVPFFRTALQRVFSNVDGYNAIQGRVGNWDSAIGPMHGWDIWLGYGDSAEYPYYLAGLPDTIYKYGIIGVALELFCFIYLLTKKFSNFEVCFCVVFILLFCVAHLTSVFIQVFYFGILVANVIGPKQGPDNPETL